MSRGRGYIADPAGHLVTSVHHLLGAVGTTPQQVSLEPFLPPRFDQKQTSSCTGNATSGAIATRFAAMGDPLPAPPSRTGIYTLARCIDRVPGADGVLTPLVDDGAMPNQVMRGIAEWGISSETAWPFDPATINDEPRLDELETLGIKLDGQYRIDERGPARIARIRQALAAGYPITFAVQVDEAFNDYDGHGVLSAPKASEGGHYLFAHGYEVSADGSFRMRFANSWGDDWGDRGLAVGDEPFVNGMTDIYVMDLSRRAA